MNFFSLEQILEDSTSISLDCQKFIRICGTSRNHICEQLIVRQCVILTSSTIVWYIVRCLGDIVLIQMNNKRKRIKLLVLFFQTDVRNFYKLYLYWLFSYNDRLILAFWGWSLGCRQWLSATEFFLWPIWLH